MSGIPDYPKYPAHVCRFSNPRCRICKKTVKRGQKYYDAGIRQAHVSCVSNLGKEKSK